MSDVQEWRYLHNEKEGFSIDPINPSKGKFDLEVVYWDSNYGEETEISVDALEVYEVLKYYFKGTKYE